FESYATTDDHLMHLTGLATDQNGTKYYLTKNSWGEVSQYKGFLYMSDAYFRMKTIGIMVHKDAIPKDIAAKLSL
ncbi:MAG: aminopeptidase, partial [Phaeodactylibacter sp.]|nr:aminopeptidase [Phaeodactylibacter sp.]